MLKPGHQQFCSINHKNSIYTFENFRDFDRHDEEKNKQHWINIQIDSENINGLDLYIIPFALRNIIGHSILGFTCDDGTKIFLSVEGEQKSDQEYSFWKAIYPGYRIRYIWGSEKDIIGLRRKIRKEKMYRYPLHIEKKLIQKIFKNLALETNLSRINKQPYGLLFNNCSSSLRKSARKSIKIPKRNIGLIFNTFLPRILQKLQILHLQEKEKIQ